MTTPVDGTSAAATQAQQQYVTIRQPDGSTYRVPQIKATWDPEAKAWQTNVRPEDVQTANHINRKHGQSLGADDFMKLLVAQMQYQDPSNPADTTAMMQQTASMAMLERVNEMTTSAESMAKAVEKLTASNDELRAYYAGQQVEQRMSTAVGMIGARIAYADPADASRSLDGVVDSVKFSESGPILIVSGTDVPLGSVKSVLSPATAAPSPSSPDTTQAPAPSTGATTESTGSTTGSPATDGTTAGDDTGTTGTPA